LFFVIAYRFYNIRKSLSEAGSCTTTNQETKIQQLYDQSLSHTQQEEEKDAGTLEDQADDKDPCINAPDLAGSAATRLMESR
jgi:hypothetical protein